MEYQMRVSAFAHLHPEYTLDAQMKKVYEEAIEADEEVDRLRRIRAQGGEDAGAERFRLGRLSDEIADCITALANLAELAGIPPCMLSCSVDAAKLRNIARGRYGFGA